MSQLVKQLRVQPRVLAHLTTTTTKRCYFNPINPDYPYISELYKKNYMRYPAQSRGAINVDKVYRGDERLRTYEERMEEFKDPYLKLHKNISKQIHLPDLSEIQKKMKETVIKGRNDRALEVKSMKLQIEVPIDDIRRQAKYMNYMMGVGNITNHYNINKDFFAQAYFLPVLDLSVSYKRNDSTQTVPVYHGTKIAAQDAVSKPTLAIDDLFGYLNNKQTKPYHSVVFVNLDGNFQNSDDAVLLWFLGNVKDGDFSNGQEIVPYLQPFPMRGSGWHRCAYLLFEHDEPIDFKLDALRNSTADTSTFPQARSFKTAQFYIDYQSSITPVGVAFFQTEWDVSVRDVFHKTFDMHEPVYEYQFEPRFIPRFEKYPTDQPFNWYLQEYKDMKKVHEEMLKTYLPDLSPFEPYAEPEKYQHLAGHLANKYTKPRWYRYEMENMRRRRQQFSLIPFPYTLKLNSIEKQIAALPFAEERKQKDAAKKELEAAAAAEEKLAQKSKKREATAN